MIPFKRLTPASFPTCAYLTPPRTRSSTLELGSVPGSSTWIKSCRVNNCPGPVSKTLTYRMLCNPLWQVTYKLLVNNHLKMNVCVTVFNPCSPSAPVGVLDPSSCHAWEGCWVSTPIHSSWLSCPWKATAGGTGMSGVACPVRPLVKIFMTPKTTEWPENQIAITPTKHTVDMGH